MSYSNTDLHIRVKSKLGTTQQVLLYQEAVTLNVKNFKTAAWEHQSRWQDHDQTHSC